MAQQQYYSLAALAERDQDKPFAKPTAATPPAAPDRVDDEDDDELETDALRATFALHLRDALREG
jgi:hypothetical protein